MTCLFDRSFYFLKVGDNMNINTTYIYEVSSYNKSDLIDNMGERYYIIRYNKGDDIEDCERIPYHKFEDGLDIIYDEFKTHLREVFKTINDVQSKIEFIDFTFKEGNYYNTISFIFKPLTNITPKQAKSIIHKYFYYGFETDYIIPYMYFSAKKDKDCYMLINENSEEILKRNKNE